MQHFLARTVLVCAAAVCACATAPEIRPETGWVPHRGGETVEWTRNGVAYADRNGDGLADYRRESIPAFSYDYRIWFDDDFDGWFSVPAESPEPMRARAPTMAR